ncbi:hypothetical protein BDV95DRAFT_589280 [Massariosphaeria phaeospora]|uniref:Uncharacterized protein n=1 Tax=Massariosphaeria phaeospora TaxID=100035 RepID=A0A7C8IK28_9PLEO|nr:hypothetical protein BDV95DRAFT_589280 [Massariosphaeria phaeospora]
MPPFSRLLPLALLPYVLDYLSKQEYSSLVRVCKYLNKEVTPYLYREISFRAGKSRGCARKLAFLLRTFLERPQFSSHVNIFRLSGPHPCWTKYNPWPEEHDRNAWSVNLWGLEGCTTLSKTQMIFVTNQFYQLVDADMHKSPTQFRGRSKDALAILVLTRLTQLTTLKLGDGFLMYSLFLPQILKRADHLFPKLEHVVFGDRMPDLENSFSYMDLDLVRPIFHSPTVQNFEWTMSQPWQFGWNTPEPPKNTHLTSLHLFRTNINRATLNQLLSVTPNLKRFRFQHEILFNNVAPGSSALAPFLHLDGLNQALSNVKDSLEDCKLTLGLAPGSLSFKYIVEEGLHFPPVEGTLTVLKGMKKLKNVEVPLVMFLGWSPDFAARLDEVLPEHIEDVTLRDDFVRYSPWTLDVNCGQKMGRIEEYVGGRTVHASKLRTLKIKLTAAKKDHWLLEAVKDLRALIGEKGVQHWVSNELVKENYCWQFEHSEDSRKDSVIPGVFFTT